MISAVTKGLDPADRYQRHIFDDRDAGILYIGNGRMLVTWFSHPTLAYLTDYFFGIKNSAQQTEAAPVIGMLSMYQYIPEELSRGGSFIRISEDYGVTWSDTIQIQVSSPHGPSLCKDGTRIPRKRTLLKHHGRSRNSLGCRSLCLD